ncbi:hypothetical protein, partial [Methylocella sp.]|uniref:hypothetical protein n=1 Tax=Methylocella sp. TaxID=1978226 RepID=UPI0035AF7B97
MLEVASTDAFRASVLNRPDLALTIAVAALGPVYSSGASPCVSLSGGVSPFAGRDAASGLLRAIESEGFDQALPIVAAAPLADLTVAFCEIVAMSISTRDPYGRASRGFRAGRRGRMGVGHRRDFRPSQARRAHARRGALRRE